jgi:hypothetical protein
VAQTGDAAKRVIRRKASERPNSDRRKVFIVITFGKTKQLGPDSGEQGEPDNTTFSRVQERQNPRSQVNEVSLVVPHYTQYTERKRRQ